MTPPAAAVWWGTLAPTGTGLGAAQPAASQALLWLRVARLVGFVLGRLAADRPAQLWVETVPPPPQPARRCCRCRCRCQPLRLVRRCCRRHRPQVHARRQLTQSRHQNQWRHRQSHRQRQLATASRKGQNYRGTKSMNAPAHQKYTKRQSQTQTQTRTQPQAQDQATPHGEERRTLRSRLVNSRLQSRCYGRQVCPAAHPPTCRRKSVSGRQTERCRF